ncbi:YiiX/YebB-like N1pC/P60 family cysteine hydrolase [Roseateles sp.]|uniref:YiiX/YebB-like N1pC/P60 family cysteine hydrolase n=1 Tax=Roseateles sp. TaxID=1971397 RepID=UPI002DFDB7EF|nr:YiiX/YebB-like N1pC/P60 family cysteine hydrolase [Roseateles sp.]
MTTPGSPARRFIKDGALLPGDIVLTTTPAKLSATIRKVTSADISHAMLCVADGSVIDSTGEGVHARNPQWMVVEPGCAFHLLRPAAPVTSEQLQTLIRYAREQVSMPYTKVGAVQALLKKGRITRHQFCSRLVAQAYRAAGIPLVPDADRCTPAELLQSPLLVEVHDALRELTPAEEEALASRVDRTQLMRDVTNDLIAGARKIAPGIDTLNDIDLYLQAHPEADAALCQVLISSGYLDVWRGEEVRHPWQYSVEEMDRLPHAGMHQYCLGVISDETIGTNRFVFNRAGYRTLHAEFGLEYFRLKIELYSNVAAQHLQRVKTAADWLVKHGHMQKPAHIHLRPHTPEWFESLRSWDPVQAGMTQIIIEAAGSAEVCTVCGDDPASDYLLVHPAPAGPGTIRLCEDCYEIRSPDEPMTPLPEVAAADEAAAGAPAGGTP